MEKLELGFYDAIYVGSDEEMPDASVECVNEVLEHTILDKMMEGMGGMEDLMDGVTCRW